MKDYIVMDIDEILKAYSGIPDWIGQVERKFLTLFLFYERNNLITKKVSDGSGKVIDRRLKKSDFSEQGFLFDATVASKWLASKGSQKDPPNLKILEEGLRRLRQE